MDQRGEVRAELDSAVVPSVRGQPGETVSVHSGVQPWELPSPAVSAQGGQALVAAERAGQADQDGRPSGAALPSIDLSVVRGVGFLNSCSKECWIVSAGYRRRQAEGGYNHDFAKREERSRESACLQCAFTPLAGDPKTTKTDKKHGSRRESHLLSDRPEIEWPCRT